MQQNFYVLSNVNASTDDEGKGDFSFVPLEILRFLSSVKFTKWTDSTLQMLIVQIISP